MVRSIMKRGHSVGVALLCAAATFAGGCSSSQMSRIDRNRDIYETWPLETKQAVLDGRVEPGMDTDMVRVAWGEPSEIATSPAGDEIWVFKRGGSDGSVYYPGGVASGGGIGGGGIGGTGTGIGISTGRGGTVIGSSGGIGIGGGIGGTGIGGGGIGGIGGIGGGMGGIGGPIITPPTPPDVREVVFRNGKVVRADPPFGKN